MPEHTIPKSLLENIRGGHAALVVGAGVGLPSWKEVLERLNQTLRDRGQSGDEAAAKDVEKLLHKGNLVRAAGFLGRSLGAEICDRVIAEMWKDARRASRDREGDSVSAHPPGVDDLPRRASRAGDGRRASRGMAEPQVVTFENAAQIDVKRRTLLKVLGDFDRFIATPASIRKALAGADDLRRLIKPFYAEGSLPSGRLSLRRPGPGGAPRPRLRGVRAPRVRSLDALRVGRPGHRRRARGRATIFRSSIYPAAAATPRRRRLSSAF